MAVYFHEEDLPEGLEFGDRPIAVDTEAMGLLPGRDRLCLTLGAEHLGCSGILAAVAAGIMMSYMELSGRALGTTRMQRTAVWGRPMTAKQTRTQKERM